MLESNYRGRCLPKVVSQEEFLARAREKHGEKFDYSKATYTRTGDKVTIICPTHGEFTQSAGNHLAGYGCRACAGVANTKKQSSNTETFIRKAKAIHGDKFDYSKVTYTRGLDKVTIICPVHGEFRQQASSHLGGRGCRQCAGLAPLTTEIFKQRARAVHGEKFDYSKVNYTRAGDKVTIICPVHGEFSQIAAQHVAGRGCSKCAGRNYTTQDFINAAHGVHGDRFDYSESVYVSVKQKVTIICHEHGEFVQTPESHLNGALCPKCRGRNRSIPEFIAMARLVHGEKYDYSMVDSTKIDDKVTIICPQHGEFEQRVDGHLRGKGCLECSGRAPISREYFIDRAESVHGAGSYDYSQVEINGIDTKVTIICPEHGPFEQTPWRHINAANGCSACANYGFNPSKPAILYFLQIDRPSQSPVYKIGVTNRSVFERFPSIKDRARIAVLLERQYDVGQEALAEEKRLLKRYRRDLYTGPDVLVGGGNTELFTRNILASEQEEISS